MLAIYNTLTGKKEPFQPLDPKTVRMYVCGVTVYDYCHLGHARSALVFDMIRRYLEYSGYTVDFVKNFTDVDDRTIAGAQKAGIDLRSYTDQFVNAFLEDARALGLEEVEEMPRATDDHNIQAMADLIRALEQKGHTYRSDGSIYFRISTLPGYGRLAHLDADLRWISEAGERLEQLRTALADKGETA